MSTIWIYHPDLDVKSEVPDVSVPNYLARGWVVTDPPPEPIPDVIPAQPAGALGAVDSPAPTEAAASPHPED